MNKKNSNAQNLNRVLEGDKKISEIYSAFKNKISSLKKANFIVAVSGGSDSLSLAALAKLYQNEIKVKVSYFLIDHQIRKNSAKEALQVKKLLKKSDIFLRIIKNKKKITSNVQGNARKIRYNLLSSKSKKNKNNYILTGHHSNDQIETFLIRLSRESGVQGLSSMKFLSKLSKNTFITRPFLETQKKDLTYLAKKFFGKIFYDPSNKNSKYLRTKMRYLQKALEKSGIENKQILKSIKNLSSTNYTLNSYIDKIYKLNVEQNKKKISINFKNIIEETPEVQFRIFSTAFKNLSKLYYPPRSKKIMNLLSGLKANKQKRYTLAKCLIEKRKNYILIKKER